MKISLKIDGVLDADCTPEFNGKVLIVHTSKEYSYGDQSLEVIIEDEFLGLEGITIPSAVHVIFDKEPIATSVMCSVHFKN